MFSSVFLLGMQRVVCMGVLVACFGPNIDGAGLLGGRSICQGHVFAPKGHIWLCVRVCFVLSLLF